MTATVITTAAIKGGCAKTTTTGVTAWLLAKNGYKVLAVDGDPQGNLTEMFFLEPVRDMRMRGEGGIFEAIKEKNPMKYIKPLQSIVDNDDDEADKAINNIDVLVGEETFGVFPDYLYQNLRNTVGVDQVIKKNLIDLVKDKYDFIIIDTAPTLNKTLINFIVASDFVLGLFETNKFCYSALNTLYETVYTMRINKVNSNIDFVGILISQMDNRRTDNKEFLEIIRQDEYFKDLCFNSVIVRKAATGRLSFTGFYKNPEINSAVLQFKPYVEELIARVQSAKGR